MATFAFRAVDIAGSPARGEVEAESKAHVSEQLRERGLIVLDITERREAIKIEDLWKRWRTAKGRDLAVMSRQFATMISSGMPMLRALYTLEDQTEAELVKEAIAAVRADVEAGASLADAMARHPQVFDRLYTSMVRSGEQSGQLEAALDRIAYQLEKMDALKRQVRSAMMYPAVVMSFAFVVLIALVSFIVPVFAQTFTDIARDNPEISSDLPWLTAQVVALSDLITQRFYIVFPALAAAMVAFHRWRKSARGKRVWDRFVLRLPMKIGDVVQKVSLARWSRVFSGLVSAGVPLLQAVTVTGQTSGNTVIEQAMDSVYESVRTGGSIAKPLGEEAIFPTMVTHMVGVGEQSGSLEHMLSKVADFYEAEVEARIKALTSIIEPMMLIFVGAIVGVIVIAMYLPLFSLYDKIQIVPVPVELLARGLGL